MDNCHPAEEEGFENMKDTGRQGIDGKFDLTAPGTETLLCPFMVNAWTQVKVRLQVKGDGRDT